MIDIEEVGKIGNGTKESKNARISKGIIGFIKLLEIQPVYVKNERIIVTSLLIGQTHLSPYKYDQTMNSESQHHRYVA